MRTRQIVGISVLSSVLTLLAVFVLLQAGGTVLAQRPVPTPATIVAPPQDPDGQAGRPHSPAQPEAPQAGVVYQHIAGSTFVPLYWDAKPVYDYGGCTYGDATATPSRVIYNLPVILPPGSTINYLRYYYKDTSASDSTVRLREMDDGQSLVDIATVSSAGNSGYGNGTVHFTHTVDYVNYSYVIQWYANVAGSTMELCGVRIGYTPPSIFGVALPAVIKN